MSRSPILLLLEPDMRQAIEDHLHSVNAVVRLPPFLFCERMGDQMPKKKKLVTAVTSPNGFRV